MPRKITKKKTATQKLDLRSIQELDNIDIYNSLGSDQTNLINIIKQLEECLPDYRDILLKNFLTLFMKLCGLEEFVAKLEDSKDMDNFKLAPLLQVVEDFQIKNDKSSLVSEDAAKRLIEKSKDDEHFNGSLVKFFDTLFNTDLPYDCERFFELNFCWLSDMMRCRVRIVRVACLELIQIILSQIFSRINMFHDDEILNNIQIKSLIKFSEAIRTQIMSHTIKDVYLPIQKKTINICFQYMSQLPKYFGDPSHFESLGHMFTHEKSECREEAMKCYHMMISEATKSKNETLQQLCVALFKQQQDRIIQPIFDHNNELTQVDTIKTLTALTLLQSFNKDCLKPQNISNLVTILYRSNDRVKFELIHFIQTVDEEFDTCLKGQGSQSLHQVIELCLKYKPHSISLQTAAQRFISPFLLIHGAVSIPENYINIMLQHETKTDQPHVIINNFESSAILQTLISFYGECIRLSRIYESSSNLFYWFVFEEQKLEQLCSIYETFSHTFFKHLKTLQLQLQSDNDILVAYLSLIGQLNLGELSENQNQEIFEYLLGQIQRIFEVSQDSQVLKQCAILFKQINLSNGSSRHDQLIQDVAKEMKSGLIYFIEKEGPTEINMCKMLYMIQYTHFLLNELLSVQQIQGLRIQSQDLGKQEKFLELLAYSVISSFKTFLKVEIKTLKNPTKNLQDFFDEFELTRNMFIEDTFKSLEQHHSLRVYSQLINVLSYINNNKVSFTRDFGFQLNEQQQILLFQTFHNNVLKKLDVQQQIQDESQSIETLNVTNQIESKLTELSEGELLALTDTLNLFKVSLKCIDMNFGVPILHFLLMRSLEAKSTKGYVTNLLHELFNQWFNLEFSDQNRDTLVYWKVILDIVRYTALKSGQKSDTFYTEFWRMILDNYFVKNANAKMVTQSMKKEKFIMFCAELIFYGFSKIEEIDIISFCVPMFLKSGKIMKKLEIDKSTIKKICAFFEAKRQGFVKKHTLNEAQQKHFEQITTPVSNCLKEISGISQVDLQRVMDQQDKENTHPNNVGEQKPQYQNNEEENPITNQELLRQEISNEEQISQEEEVTKQIESGKKTSTAKAIKHEEDVQEIDGSKMIQKKFKRNRK